MHSVFRFAKKGKFFGAIGKQAATFSLPEETAVKLKLRETRTAKRCFELTSHTSLGFRQTDRDRRNREVQQ
jgi:hypothetical protein